MSVAEWAGLAYVAVSVLSVIVLAVRGDMERGEAKLARKDAGEWKEMFLEGRGLLDAAYGDKHALEEKLEQAQAELARTKEWESSLAVALAKEKTERQQAQAALLEAAAQLEKAREAYAAQREAWKHAQAEAARFRDLAGRLLEPARDALGLPAKEEA